MKKYLITNLPSETFDCRQIAELYHMRWGSETAYETLKDRLQIENFTGTKPVLLLQDIYSAIYISNLAEDIIRDAEAVYAAFRLSVYYSNSACSLLFLTVFI